MTQLQSGFTLLELMIVVAIAGVLAAFALPNYVVMVKNNCLTTDANAIVTSFQLARSEAIKRHTTVKITASNTGDNINEWGLGWNVTLNEDHNGDGILDAGEDYDGDGALGAAALVRSVSLTCVNTTVDEINADITAFTYQPNGMIDKQGSFEICDDRTAEEGRHILLTSTGRISTNSRYACP